jgi:hypothetical protein
LAEDRPLSTDQPHGKIRRVAGRSAHAHRHSRASDWTTVPHARAILWLVAILAVAVVTGLSNDEAATLGVLSSRSSVAGLLLLFSITGQSVSDVLTSDALGPEIAASLIGATALVSVVPLTTAIAAFFAHDRKAIRAVAGR